MSIPVHDDRVRRVPRRSARLAARERAIDTCARTRPIEASPVFLDELGEAVRRVDGRVERRIDFELPRELERTADVVERRSERLKAFEQHGASLSVVAEQPNIPMPLSGLEDRDSRVERLVVVLIDAQHRAVTGGKDVRLVARHLLAELEAPLRG